MHYCFTVVDPLNKNPHNRLIPTAFQNVILAIPNKDGKVQFHSSITGRPRSKATSEMITIAVKNDTR